MVTHYPFPVAAHTYFHALNKHSQKRDFLAGLIEQPEFTYNPYWTSELIESRLKMTQGDLFATQRLEVVLASLRLRKNSNELEAFRAANSAIFHVPTRELAEAVLGRMLRHVTQENIHLWKEVLELLKTDVFKDISVAPNEETFQKYREYLLQYTTLPEINENLEDALREQLVRTGLADDGWELNVKDGAMHAQTVHRRKTVSLGRDYKPRSASAVRRITIHEVIGHAKRGPQHTLEESEGFAIVLEQLTKSTFIFRRSYRYLAVALGWGVFGKPMNFREVYEVMWRLMVIQSKYSIESAKEHAFDECYRAFRGGRPDIAGAVFLKDTVYLDANIRMWTVLNTSELSYNEFVDSIEGRRTILS